MQGDDHRGGGRVMSLSDDQIHVESQILYVEHQIRKYHHFTKLVNQAESERSAEFYQSQRESCLWRIASTTNLFGDALAPTMTLTDAQWNQAIDFIEQFQGGQV